MAKELFIAAMAHDIFISYCHKDKKVAEAICKRFQTDGIRYWIDDHLPAGARWGDDIVDAIEACRAMVLVYSSAASVSENIKDELMEARDLRKEIIPLRVDATPLIGEFRLRLKRIQWLDTTTGPMETHLATLSTRIKSLLKLEEPAPPTPSAPVASKVNKPVGPNIKSARGRGAFLAPIKEGDTNSVRTLIDKGADVDAKDYSFTALSWAAYHGQADIVRLLIDKGANVNAKPDSGFTALMWAATKGHSDIMRLLLDKGADFDTKTKHGQTALMNAAYKGKSGIVRTLLGKGADVNAKGNDGSTALITAAYWGHSVAVRMLLSKGADVNAKGNDGATALNWAVRKGHDGIAKMLSKAGAK